MARRNWGNIQLYAFHFAADTRTPVTKPGRIYSPAVECRQYTYDTYHEHASWLLLAYCCVSSVLAISLCQMPLRFFTCEWAGVFIIACICSFHRAEILKIRRHSWIAGFSFYTGRRYTEKSMLHKVWLKLLIREVVYFFKIFTYAFMHYHWWAYTFAILRSFHIDSSFQRYDDFANALPARKCLLAYVIQVIKCYFSLLSQMMIAFSFCLSPFLLPPSFHFRLISNCIFAVTSLQNVYYLI